MIKGTRRKPGPSPDESEALGARQVPSVTDAKPRNVARFATSAPVNAAAVVQQYAAQPFGPELDLESTVLALTESMDQVTGGEMKTAEAMLMGQAMALQAMYVHMARRVLQQPSQKHLEGFFAMALRAQNQCRMTIETLGELKHPRQVAFVRQTNVAGGHQQVNNGRSGTHFDASTRAGARAREKESQPSKLLEAHDDE